MYFRGYHIRVGGPHPRGVVQIWSGDELISRETSIDRAKRVINEWLEAK